MLGKLPKKHKKESAMATEHCPCGAGLQAVFEKVMSELRAEIDEFAKRVRETSGYWAYESMCKSYSRKFDAKKDQLELLERISRAFGK